MTIEVGPVAGTIFWILLALTFIFSIISTIRKFRLRDRLNEEAERKLEEYFAARDAGAPADPTLVIQHEWHYINRVQPLGFWLAEEEYQDELKKREQDRQHQAHLDWVAAHNPS